MIWFQAQRGRDVAARTWQLRMPATLQPRSYAWAPPTDIFETDRGGFVRVEIAGMGAADIELAFADGRLVIFGSRGEPGVAGRCALKEIASGHFRVEVDVPWRVDTRAVRAAYRDGFLTVELPRAAGPGLPG